ncbi:MAG: transposase family protein [Planctomycetales bacterium]|nr:transposase family protein [Planctomycetales bacterium]MBN8628937.1 transposase family protein [Planctomycetota bacterium]
MSELTEHDRRLLGLDESWRVANVAFLPQKKRVEITREHVGGRLTCPECQASCPQADTAEERKWRHLDVMQFDTRITAAVPRCRCSACSVKTVAVPWAGKHSRFTQWTPLRPNDLPAELRPDEWDEVSGRRRGTDAAPAARDLDRDATHREGTLSRHRSGV